MFKILLADFPNGDRSNIRRIFGYTALFQPQKPVEQAEAAALFMFFGIQSEKIFTKDVRQIKGQQNQPSTMSSQFAIRNSQFAIELQIY